uniref:Putative lipocalin-6 1 n=1 Tax=Amblyomma triste TaxID=251400 RepID=A0A023G349_AMBTT
MRVFAELILFAHVIKVFGTETSSSCSTASTTNARIDGYKLLGLGARFRLARTNFDTITESGFRCITATTKERDDSRHEVTEEVVYNVRFTEWYAFRQKFKFVCGSGGYDTMVSTDNSTVPHASYRFLTVEESCLIIEYLKARGEEGGQEDQETNSEDGLHSEGNEKDPNIVQPQARDSGKEGSKQLRIDCLLWMKLNEGDNHEPSDECIKKFEALCGAKIRQSFTTRGCDFKYTEYAYNKLIQVGKTEDGEEETLDNPM